MFTTAGATCLAIWVKVLDNSTGLGMTSGVAPGAALSPFAALTPDVIRVPRTIPTDRVNRISVKESSFCVRNLSKKLMVLLTPLRKRSRTHYLLGCDRRFNGFNSTNTTPPMMKAATTEARADNPSPARRNEVTQATTGSSMYMTAVRVGVVCCCAQA